MHVYMQSRDSDTCARARSVARVLENISKSLRTFALSIFS